MKRREQKIWKTKNCVRNLKGLEKYTKEGGATVEEVLWYFSTTWK